MNEPIFIRHAWLMFIAVTVVNALITKLRSRPHIRQNPELAAGYQQLFNGILFWGNLPWVVMGIGIDFGGVHSVFSYFRPRDGNPFVLAWFGAVVALWLLGFYWLFARRGAEFLVAHPGLLQGDPKNPAKIRFFYCLMVAGGVAGLCMMFLTDIPEFIVPEPSTKPWHVSPPSDPAWSEAYTVLSFDEACAIKPKMSEKELEGLIGGRSMTRTVKMPGGFFFIAHRRDGSDFEVAVQMTPDRLVQDVSFKKLPGPIRAPEAMR